MYILFCIPFFFFSIQYFICFLLRPSSDYSLGCSLLLRRQGCSFNNGEQAELPELEHWCQKANHEVIILDSRTVYFPFLIFRPRQLKESKISSMQAQLGMSSGILDRLLGSWNETISQYLRASSIVMFLIGVCVLSNAPNKVCNSRGRLDMPCGVSRAPRKKKEILINIMVPKVSVLWEATLMEYQISIKGVWFISLFKNLLDIHGLA